MKEQTVLASAISTVDQEAQYDDCVKKLLSEKVILAWILKECTDEFKDFPIQKIVRECIPGKPEVSVIAVDQDELDRGDILIEGMNTEDSSIREGKVYYDIRFRAVVPDTKKPIQLIVNVEAQKSDETPYPLIKRAIYYGSRMISAQKNRVFVKSHYEKIQKVYSIWIQMNVGSERANTITRYRILEENIVGTVKEKVRNYDLMTIMMLGLGDPGTAFSKPILRLLDVLLSGEMKPDEKQDLLEKDFKIPMTEKMQEEVNVMCNLGEGLVEKTARKTRLETRKETSQEKNVDHTLVVMGRLKLNAAEAVEWLDIPEEERPSTLAGVEKKLSSASVTANNP